MSNPASQANPFIGFIKAYRKDPVSFVKEVLGVNPDPWQSDLLMAIATGERRISVRSGHGVGKTAVTSWAMLWYVLTRYPCKVIVTAPTSAQLFDALFAELKRWAKELPPALNQLLEVKNDRVELKASASEAFISARTSRAEQPEALAGVHCFAQGTVDVFTRRGWVPLEDVTLGDDVLAKRVGSNQAAYENPLEIIDQPYSGPMHVHNSRLFSFMVTPGHKFEYEKRQCNITVSKGVTERWVHEVRAIKDIPRLICRVPKTFNIIDPDVQTYAIEEYTSRRYGVPLRTRTSVATAEVSSATRPEIAFDVGDWAEYLGWYLSEGSIGRTRFGTPCTVSIAQSRESNWQKYSQIVQLIKRMGLSVTLGRQAVFTSSAQLARHVAQIVPGKAETKRVPSFVFDFPQRAIRRFLDAFRSGDGCGEWEYYTSSPGLADDIQRLVLLVGGYATINKFERKGSAVTGFPKHPDSVRKTDYYRIREWKDWSKDHAMMRPEKRSVVQYSGRVSCLTMPSGMFYVRDRKSLQPFWTHNSDNVLLVADEASGVPEAVFEAAAGSMSGHNATTILLGNPTRSSGYFYETHHRLKSEWWTRRVSCIDSPRVSEAYVNEMKSRYGEESNAYRIRVLGEFPLADDDTVIPVDLVESAQHRDTKPSPTAPVVWGLDVARFGSDKSALCKRQANVVHEIRKWAGLDLMQLTGAIVAEYEATPSNIRPAEILVDSIGLGAGVVDRLRELKLPARGINVSESPALGTTYINLRAELWFRVKAWLEARDCRIPRDDQLFAELVGPRFSFSSNGKMRVESKDEMRRRGLGSPDMADALCLTFAGNAATALYGRQHSQNWSQPILRRIPGVV